MISIITACKNRNDNLLKSIQSWVVISEVTEIIVVDFDSDIPVVETLHEILSNYNHIKIIRVDNQPKWILTVAMNLAARFTTQDKILKLDSDDVLKPNFLQCNKLEPGTFISGNWKNSRNHNEKHLNGILFVYKDDFFSVNGYNEYLVRYGYDDSSLYQRLLKNGLTQKDIDNDTVNHIEHSDKMRSSTNLFNDIHYNRFLSQLLPWSDAEKMCSFDCEDKRYLLNHKLVSYVEAKLVKYYAIVQEDIVEKCQNMLDNYLKILREIEIEKNKNSNILYVHVLGGFGNKLRSLLSAYSLYKFLRIDSRYNRFNWKFVIIFTPDFHCEAGFFDLFKKIEDPNVSVTTEIPVVTSKTLQIFSDNRFDEQVETEQQQIIDLLQKIENSKTPNVIYLESANVLNFIPNNWRNDCENLKYLIPSDKVQKIVDETVKDLDMKNIIAIHLRVGQDEKKFDDISNWSKDKQQSWIKWRKSSNITRFIRAIDEKLKENPKTKFYFTSDSEKTYTELLEKYPDNMYCIRRECFDRTTEQVVIGFAEILIMSKCPVGLLSNWSSYTESIVRYNNNMKKYLAGVDF